jgi:hypothetical protein
MKQMENSLQQYQLIRSKILRIDDYMALIMLVNSPFY